MIADAIGKNKSVIVPIDQRPAIVNDSGRFGDWEIDTIIGENNRGAILTVVERTIAYFMMEKLEHEKKMLRN